MHIKKLDDNIIYYENVLDFPKNFIDKIEELDLINNNINQLSKWSEWNASNENKKYGITKNGNFSSMQYNTKEDIETSLLIYKIKAISDLCFANYMKETNCNFLKLPDYFSIRKYDTSVDMGEHVDAEDPTDKSHPVISGVLYLNDSYTGGEIYFKNQNIKIKPSAGSMVMFPSYRPYTHHPMPVTEGDKYMIPFFWYPMETVWK
ncbi:MAG: 2OG-Fe(II) oxygenase [Nitrososphaeria archaeon]|jgi:predicted 2-oxoglutarate/Fe(II)-dependent dioxygenase YbiX|nr:2OG-Fe(II) oxygenase [Nitrososphaeria archaeon]